MGEKNKLYFYEVFFKGNRRETCISGQEIKHGTVVIVSAEKGFDSGKISASKIISEEKAKSFPKIHRIATQEDIERISRNAEKEKNAFRLCKERIVEHNLDMKLVGVEMRFDGGKLTFYFTSPQRVDFRELVKSLAGIYHTRIDLRQIGAREEARFISGIGPCGRIQCCSSCCMTDFKEITAQQAKDQQLSMNPLKNSGNCGRYLCCLTFEEECYIDAYTRVPRAGTFFTPEGGKKGEVIFVDIFKERIQVKFIERNGNEKPISKYEWFDLEQIKAGKCESDDIKNERKKNEYISK